MKGKFHSNWRNCPFQSLVTDYVQGEISPQRILEVEDHLQDCHLCQLQVEEDRRLMEELRRLSTPQLSRDLTCDIRSKLPPSLSPQTRSGHFFAWSSLAAGLLLATIFALSLTSSFYRPLPTSSGPVIEKKQPPLDRALDWLRKTQEKDGAWRPEKWGGREIHTLEVTSFASLALLENSPRLEKPRAWQKGLVFLKNQQNSDGSFGLASQSSFHHALITWTLLRGWEKSRQKDLKLHLSRALDYLEKDRETFHLKGEKWLTLLWKWKVISRARKLGWDLDCQLPSFQKNIPDRIEREGGLYTGQDTSRGRSFQALITKGPRSRLHYYSCLLFSSMPESSSPREVQQFSQQLAFSLRRNGVEIFDQKRDSSRNREGGEIYRLALGALLWKEIQG